jgi:hypothetical protein
MDCWKNNRRFWFASREKTDLLIFPRAHFQFASDQKPDLRIFLNLTLNSLNQSNFKDVLLESKEEFWTGDPAHAADCSPSDLVVELLNWN